LDEIEPSLGALGSPRPRVRHLLERGSVFNSSGQPERAVPIFLEALRAAEAAGEDGLAVDAAHMLGICAPASERLEWNHRALALAERSEQPAARRWLASLYNNIGWIHHGAGEYAAALDLFEKALSLREARSQVPETRIARWCVARTLRSMARLDEALSMQRRLAVELEADDQTDGYVDEEIAECLLALGRAREARGSFARAHELLAADQGLAAREPARLERLKKLSREE
jgi:tetratricopeptide (TPR) repeat protein